MVYGVPQMCLKRTGASIDAILAKDMEYFLDDGTKENIESFVD